MTKKTLPPDHGSTSVNDPPLSRRSLIQGAVGLGFSMAGVGCSSSDEAGTHTANGGSSGQPGTGGATAAGTGGSSTGGSPTEPAGGTSDPGLPTGGTGEPGTGGAEGQATGGTTTEPASGGAEQTGSGGADDAGTGGETSSETGGAKVYIVRATDRSAGLAELLAMADLSFALGRDVVIKPNFNSANDYPATTHNDTIEGVALALAAAGASSLTLGESSGTTETENAFQTKGLPALCAATNMELVNYDELGDDAYDHFDFPDMRWPGGSLAVPKLVRAPNAVVLLPVLKTHVWGEMTLSMKLAVGLVPTQRRWDELHPGGGGSIELIPEISKGFSSDLIVLDALRGFKSGGPDQGTECSPGLMIAGTDRVAIDAVGLSVLKMHGAETPGGMPFGSVFGHAQIRRAVEIGVDEVRSAEDIELVGNDAALLDEIRAILQA